MLESIGRFLTQTGTSDGTVSETTKQSKGIRPEWLKLEQQQDNNGDVLTTSELDVQLKLHTFTQGKTKAIVEKANSEGIERHREALRAIVKKVENIKTQIFLKK